ncbi:MAG: alanine:cation symporter family protein [Clostridium sp.]
MSARPGAHCGRPRRGALGSSSDFSPDRHGWSAYAETGVWGRSTVIEGPERDMAVWSMAVMGAGLGCRSMGLLYAFFAVLASTWHGSMVQANAVSETLRYEAGMKRRLHGGFGYGLTAAVVWGGIQRLISRTNFLVCAAVCGNLFFFSVWVLVMCRGYSVVLFTDYKEAWTPGAAGRRNCRICCFHEVCALAWPGACFPTKRAWEHWRLLHGATEDTTPEEQEHVGMFEVFFTIPLICTLTALVILCVSATGRGLR